MNLMVWDESLSVGVDVIDGQHRRIVEYINELNAAHQSHDNNKVTDILSGLVDYTLTHFTFEEGLMEQSGYPLSDAHKQVHNSFISRINSYIDRHNQGEDVTRKLMSELQIWLTNHIKNDDNDYAPFARKQLGKNKSWIGRTIGRLFG